MNKTVWLSPEAEEDLFSIWKYTATSDSVEKADNLFADIKEKILLLDAFSDRGHLPPELERVGVYEYQEIHCKQFRIIYKASEADVIVYAVLDGRRSLQDLLLERLIR